MKKFMLFLALSLSASVFANPLQGATDLEIVREVLARNIEIDVTKIAEVSAVCKGSSLEVAVTNEASGEVVKAIYYVGGLIECQKNLVLVEPKLGDFYTRQVVSICQGSSLTEITVKPNPSIQVATPRYVGVDKCMNIAAENNAN